MNSTIAFRADSGLRIGNGHVMRCLTLADELADYGVRCLFLTRPNQGNLAGLISKRGHDIELLETPFGDYGAHSSRPAHADWLGTGWRADAAATKEMLIRHTCDWLVIDHYALDSSWEGAALPDGCRIAVIDDLADRPHIADVLIDQNLGRTVQDYRSHVPLGCLILTGPRFAMLRPEFSQYRHAALEYRQTAQVNSILVSLGGVDLDNVTGEILCALSELNLPREIDVTIILGPTAPALETIRRQVENTSLNVKVLCDVANMAELMADSDLSIGAVGGSAWERAALGLPSLTLTLAKNQEQGAEALIQSGAALGLSRGSEMKSQIRNYLQVLRENPETYLAMSDASAEITDGKGTKICCMWLMSQPLKLRKATMNDAEFVWHCRHDDQAWKFNKNATPISLESHIEWFGDFMKNPDRDMFIASSAEEGEPKEFGYIRFDRLHEDPSQVEISLSLIGAARGQGLGRMLIAESVRKAAHLGVNVLIAVVHQGNATSRRAFEACGFHVADQSGSFITLVWPETNIDKSPRR